MGAVHHDQHAAAPERQRLAAVTVAGDGIEPVDVFGAVIQDWSAEDVREFSRLITRLADDWMARGPAHTRPPRRTASPRWRTGARGADL